MVCGTVGADAEGGVAEDAEKAEGGEDGLI